MNSRRSKKSPGSGAATANSGGAQGEISAAAEAFSDFESGENPIAASSTLVQHTWRVSGRRERW